MPSDNVEKIVPENKSPYDKTPIYEPVLDEDQKAKFLRIIRIRGLEEEIALLRLSVLNVYNNDPENLKYILMSMAMLEKLVRTHQELTGDQHGLAETVYNLIRDIGVPLGAAVLSKK